MAPKLLNPRSMARVSLIACLLLFFFRIEAMAAPEESEGRFATAMATEGPVSVFHSIATREIKVGNSVTSPGAVTGEPVFHLAGGQRVDLLDLYPNDNESRYTCKVRTAAGEIGFVICHDLEVQQWHGERGELVRVILEQPYEYEGRMSGPLEDMRRFGEFIERHPSSRFVPFARLEISSIKCRIALNSAMEVFEEVRDLKMSGAGESARMWTAETNQLYSSLQKKSDALADEMFNFCSLVTKLQGSVQAPVTVLGKR